MVATGWLVGDAAVKVGAMCAMLRLCRGRRARFSVLAVSRSVLRPAGTRRTVDVGMWGGRWRLAVGCPRSLGLRAARIQSLRGQR